MLKWIIVVLVENVFDPPTIAKDVMPSISFVSILSTLTDGDVIFTLLNLNQVHSPRASNISYLMKKCVLEPMPMVMPLYVITIPFVL